MNFIKYSIFCETENQRVSKWANTGLTGCPNNPAHTVNLNTVSIDGLSVAGAGSSASKTVSSTIPETHYSFIYDPNVQTVLSFISSVDTGSYEIRIIDIGNNNNILFSNTYSNNTPELIQISSTSFTNIPVNPTLVDILLSVSGSNVLTLRMFNARYLVQMR